MKILDHHPLYPGCCNLCRSSRTPVVDTLRSNQYEERVYFCAGCIEELAKAINMVGPEALEEQAGQLRTLTEERDELLEVAGEYEKLKLWVELTLQFGASIDKRGNVKLRQARPAGERQPVGSPA